MTAEAVEIPGLVAGRWAIDPVHSEVEFVIRHMMISKVRGRFTRFDGEIVTAADPGACGVIATIETTSVDTSNEQRDGHVRSDDFLAVETYPTITYRSTGVRLDGEEVVLDGDLTIKGVTRPVPLRLEVHGFGPSPFGDTRAGFTATGEINRMDFGVTANSPIPGGGVVVSENVQIVLEIQAVLQTGETSEAGGTGEEDQA